MHIDSSSTNPLIHSTPVLIRALGVAVNMGYGSSGSGGSRPPLLFRFTNHIIPAFNIYGYNVSMKDYNAADVADALLIHNRPVFMEGFRNFFGLFNGQAWVCDGADRTQYILTVFVEFLMGFPGYFYYTSHNKPSFSYPEVLHSYYLSSFFHMNWGQGHGAYNNWFIGNNVNMTNGYDFWRNRTNLY